MRRPGDGQRTYSLKELDPPGVAYDTWFIPVQGGAGSLPRGISGRAAEFLERIQRLGRVYGGAVPEAAVRLDRYLDADEPRWGDLAGLLGIAPGDGEPDGMRASVHELHAQGRFLVEVGEEDEDSDAVPHLRVVRDRPERPGDAWVFTQGA
ncbi:hypothetical protein [Streptomyces sp. NPDC048623]|uniref:hypothetical protein n=1 Tax=Streptomyces sp. NPDC048623 TaxID=3155761 RepID=UPI0034455F0A